VLGGEVTFKIGEEGHGWRAGRLRLHAARARSCLEELGRQTARVLFLYTSAGAGGFFEESQRLQPSYESFASEDVRAAYRHHRWRSSGRRRFDRIWPFCISDGWRDSFQTTRELTSRPVIMSPTPPPPVHRAGIGVILSV